jgi:hypothetical protein
MRVENGSWVKFGGAEGSISHCERCGDELFMKLPQRVEVILAAMKAFYKCHVKCEAYEGPPTA